MSLYDRWFPLPEVPAVPVIIANNVVVPPVPLDVNVASIVPISGVVYQGTNPWFITGDVTNAGTFPVQATLAAETTKVIGTVNQGTSPWAISGAVTGPLTNAELRLTPVDVNAIQSGTWTTGRTWTLSNLTDSVNIGNFPATVAVTQSTSPWVVSGSVTANAGTNLNTSLLALDSTVAKDASLTTLNTSVNTLLKPANTLAAVTLVSTVSAVTAITNALPAGSNVIGHVITDSGSVVTATLSAETTKVIGTVNQGTNPWLISGPVTNAGTFAVQATLAAETTKVIGTINIAAAQTLATVTTVGAVTAITNALPAGTNAIGTVGITTLSTSSVTSVNGNAGNVQLLASTAGRRQATFYNESTGTLYLKLGTTSSITSYTVQVPPSGYYELPLPCYTGEIDGIWSIANGAVRITELT